jgi:cytoskeletal protein CcmA (bactofilin family)
MQPKSDQLLELRDRFLRWVTAYAGTALPSDEANRLADRLSTLAERWARCPPEEEDAFLDRGKAEILEEFFPGTRAGASSSTQSGAGEAHTWLGHSFVVKGKIFSSESIYIEGRVEGAIVAPGHRVTFGPKAVVRAEVNAGEIIVCGTGDGNLRASDRVEIRNNASFVGGIVTRSISIEDGAYFKGTIDLLERTHKMTDERSGETLSVGGKSREATRDKPF